MSGCPLGRRVSNDAFAADGVDDAVDRDSGGFLRGMLAAAEGNGDGLLLHENLSSIVLATDDGGP